MLVLSRKVGEEIIVGEDIRIVIVRIKGKQVRIGVQAGPEVGIRRSELPPRSTCRNGRRVDSNGRDLGACLECEGTACE